MTPAPAPDALPFFSIVIPTRSRPEKLAVCLQALRQLDYPRGQFEVIVVDDGSPAMPHFAADPSAATLDVTVIRQAPAGPAAARNHGAAGARGAYVAFIDDDCTPSPQWLRALAAVFGSAPSAAVGGRTINALQHNLYSVASQLLVDYLYVYFSGEANPGRFFTSNNLAVPLEQFRDIGGFDTAFVHAAAEDREFCNRWLHHGFGLVYAPEAIVHHRHDLTFRRFWGQHFTYGRGAFHFHQTRARRGEPLRVEPLVFYRELVRFPYSQLGPGRTVLLLPLLLMTQVANALGFLWETVSRRRSG